MTPLYDTWDSEPLASLPGKFGCEYRLYMINDAIVFLTRRGDVVSYIGTYATLGQAIEAVIHYN